ncbi:MAG: O-antigen ligase family protein [Bacteroidetes bacterium]|nr:O-antigen ligase family protein [Bacteroidota bacterium]
MTIKTAYHKYLFSLFAAVFLFFMLTAVYTQQYYYVLLPFLFLWIYFAWEHPKQLFLLLMIAIPWSVEYNFSSSLGTDFPDEPLMLSVAGIVWAAVLYKPGVIKASVYKHPLFLLLLLHISWIIISVIFSVNAWVSVKFLLAKSWYIAAFVIAPLVFIQTKEELLKAARYFCISALIVMLVILLRHAQYGFSFAGINEAAAPFFRNHVNYSSMLVGLVPLSIAAGQLVKDRKRKKLLTVVLFITLIALFLSYARGAWLALLFGIIAYWLMQKKLLVIAFTGVITLSILLVLWMKSDDHYLHLANDYKATIFHTDFREHLVATYELKDVSTAERFNRWVAGVRMIPDKWQTGFGPNTFAHAYRPYMLPAFKTWVSDNTDNSTVHNYFLLTLIEQGLPGFLIFVLLVAAMLWQVQKIYHRSADTFYKIIAAAIGSMLVMILTVNFLSDLIETDKVGSLFFLCLSALIWIDVKQREEKLADKT